LGDTERGFLQKEVNQLTTEVNRIAESTNFNGAKLLNGETDTLVFQVGAFSDESNQIEFNAEETNVRADELGIDGLTLTSRDDARDSMPTIDEAINNVNSMRANLGAIQNRLQSTIRSLRITDENLADAKSRVADTDIAAESANLTKNKILQTAGISTLAQANSAPSQALRLIG
jgi:flagellin